MNISRYRSHRATKKAGQWVDAVNQGKTTAGFGKWAQKAPDNVDTFLLTAALPSLLRSAEGIGRMDRGELLAEANAYRIRRSEKIRGIAVAASLAFIAIVGAFLYTRMPFETAWKEYSTVGLQTRSEKLPDGTVIELASETRLRARIAQDNREVELSSGEAIFEVKHLDDGTPFVVRTREALIEVVGTRFGVNATPAQSSINVLSGVVRVSSITARGEPPRTLTQGQGIVVLAGGKISEDIATRSAPGARPASQAPKRPDLFGKTLVEIAAAFNEHNPKTRLVVEGAAQKETLWATVSLDNPEELIRILQRRSNITVTREGDRVVVRPRDTQPTRR